ncbi:SipW-dependent-type signal peptide-containing protein [Haloplanus aerogenes]|nr:SipW-dependent-type signal peptide-containing protein [Haloplanus aerogenes]RMB23999.1 putative ribosomally synthesized peptide with SipW-like signal peptide [Haloplanus aerogenes]
MDGDGFRLTRRRALSALAATGAVSAGVGVGTDAFFSDAESFDGNRVVAGELDLAVAWHKVVETATTRVATSDGWPTPRSDATAPGCDLADLKPGDSATLTLALRIDGLPGYLSLVGHERTDAERGQSEAEAGYFREAAPNAEGELDELTTATLSYLTPDDPTAPEAGGTATPAYTGSLASLVGLCDLGTGVPLDGDEAAGVYDCLVGGAPLGTYGGGQTHYLRMEWTVPPWVGSGIASDAFAFDVGLYGVQEGGG